MPPTKAINKPKQTVRFLPSALINHELSRMKIKIAIDGSVKIDWTCAVVRSEKSFIIKGTAAATAPAACTTNERLKIPIFNGNRLLIDIEFSEIIHIPLNVVQSKCAENTHSSCYFATNCFYSCKRFLGINHKECRQDLKYQKKGEIYHFSFIMRKKSFFRILRGRSSSRFSRIIICRLFILLLLTGAYGIYSAIYLPIF